MKKIMHFFFLSCLKATSLIEKKLHIELSFKERIQLYTHNLMCEACSNYEKQYLILEEHLSKPPQDSEDDRDFMALKKSIVDQLES